MLDARDEPDPGRTTNRPLLQALPRLVRRVDFAPLGDFPTGVEPLIADVFEGNQVFVKRDDRSSAIYGGNKVRTLEVLFAQAMRLDCERVVSTGAYGSNHAVATVLHARRLGLRSGVLLCPQPASLTALENLEVSASLADEARFLPHWSLLPLGIWRWRRERRAYVMAPGGATPWGALGYVSAALELAAQVQAGELPPPRTIVLPVGSTCTTAGLLVGLRLAQRLGMWASDVPRVHAVRVTPWPVTSPWRTAALARATARLLARLADEPSLAWERGDFLRGLHVDARFLGAGYGRANDAGVAAMRALGSFGAGLDTTYSAKAAAGLIRVVRQRQGPVLFWATKSTAELPLPDEQRLHAAPAAVRRWLERARHSLPPLVAGAAQSVPEKPNSDR